MLPEVPLSVFAYLDPGTGSLIMQAVVAGAAGVAVLWKTTSRRLFKKKSAEPDADVEQTATTEEPAPQSTTD